MAQIICIIGNKGGTGKTTLSHLLAHGLGLFGKYAVAVLTDIDRQPLFKVNRNYLPFDARQADNLERAVRKLRATDNWYGVVDGGGNRPQMDAVLASLADLVLIPFRDSHEDMRTLAADLARLPQAYALPSQWPTNPMQRRAADHSLTQLLGAFRSRVLAPVHSQSATKLFLQHELPAQLPSALNDSARMFALQVMERLRIALPEDRWTPIPKQQAIGVAAAHDSRQRAA
ncbi:MAG: ParA family protein [Burkholderiales bacterium]